VYRSDLALCAKAAFWGAYGARNTALKRDNSAYEPLPRHALVVRREYAWAPARRTRKPAGPDGDAGMRAREGCCPRSTGVVTNGLDFLESAVDHIATGGERALRCTALHLNAAIETCSRPGLPGSTGPSWSTTSIERTEGPTTPATSAASTSPRRCSACARQRSHLGPGGTFPARLDPPKLQSLLTSDTARLSAASTGQPHEELAEVITITWHTGPGDGWGQRPLTRRRGQ
jgi:hypothetical protein